MCHHLPIDVPSYLSIYVLIWLKITTWTATNARRFCWARCRSKLGSTLRHHNRLWALGFIIGRWFSSILRNCTRNMTVKTTRTNFVPGCWPRVGLGQKECHSERGKCETLAFYFSKVCFEEIIRHPCQTLYLMRLFCLVCGFAVSKTVWLLHQPFYSVLVGTQWWIAQAHSSIWHTSMPYIGNSRTRVTML